MGLDVYLYQYDDFAATQAAERESEMFGESLWKGLKYESTPEAQKDAIRAKSAAHAATLGLDEWGDDKTRKRKVKIDSAKYPEHMFKIGYFRSSYNSGGINAVTRDLVGMDLHDIFAPNGEYILTPDWVAAREIAVAFHRKLSNAPKLRCETISANPFGPAAKMTASQAISATETERSRPSPFGEDGYSNGVGHFYGKGLSIVAAIPGVDSFIGRNRDVVHLVYEDSLEWYLQAAEIVIETIDYVLTRPDIASYRLHWSG